MGGEEGFCVLSEIQTMARFVTAHGTQTGRSNARIWNCFAFHIPFATNWMREMSSTAVDSRRPTQIETER